VAANADLAFWFRMAAINRYDTLRRRTGTFNAPSLFVLSLLADVVGQQDFDPELLVLDPLDRTQLLHRMLTASAAMH
jgi:hypothetical protein